jgi:hypothetical protein
VLPFLKDAKLESQEGKARLAAIIRDLSAGLTGNERREVRCLELLEQIDTPAARELIRKLATGDPLAVLTEEAKKSAGRNQPAAQPRSPNPNTENDRLTPRSSTTTGRPLPRSTVTPKFAPTPWPSSSETTR